MWVTIIIVIIVSARDAVDLYIKKYGNNSSITRCEQLEFRCKNW